MVITTDLLEGYAILAFENAGAAAGQACLHFNLTRRATARRLHRRQRNRLADGMALAKLAALVEAGHNPARE
jgi:hypothetical protein